MKFVVPVALLIWPLIAHAQASGQRSPFVHAVGQGAVSTKPDLAKIDFSVITQATTAQDASTRNAAQVNALLSALQSLLGSTANIQTISYSLTPNYNYPPNGTPTLVGYTASNTIEVAASDLTMIGTIIDTGVQAGSNTVQSLVFTLKDPEPLKQQALKLATAQAKAHADAMASGVNLHTGAVYSIQEEFSVGIVGPMAAAPQATPILPGPVNVQATVTIEVNLTP